MKRPLILLVVIVAAVIAMGEPVRLLRFLGAGGAVGAAGLLLLADPDGGYAVAMVLTALAITVLSVPRGRLRDAYGDWELLTR